LKDALDSLECLEEPSQEGFLLSNSNSLNWLI
jgi:hypothetical protein